MNKNKKGQIGTVQSVLTAVGIIVVVFIALTLVLTSVNTIDTLVPIESGLTITNQTISKFLNSTNGGNSTSNASLRDVALTNVVVTNRTNSTQTFIRAGNYTLAGGRITSAGTNTTNVFMGDDVNISYTYSYRPTSNSEAVQNNITSGVANDFFTSIGSVFSILIVAIILTVVVLIFMGMRRLFSNDVL